MGIAILGGTFSLIDADGFYYIVGRKKRFLKLMGNRVNLDEAEQILKKRFQDTDIAAAGEDEHLIVYVTDASVIGEVTDYLQEKTHLNSHTSEVRFI